MTDEDIKNFIRWFYRGNPNGPMAQIIFEIGCKIRDRINRPESVEILQLKQEIEHLKRDNKYYHERAYPVFHTDWKERCYTFIRIHNEDVRRRLEVRRFRLANFSIAELQAELQRRHAQFTPDIWTPIEDGDYTNVAKNELMRVKEGGKEITFFHRRKEDARQVMVRPYQEYRFCRLTKGENTNASNYSE